MSLFARDTHIMVTVAMNKPDVTVVFEEPLEGVYETELISAVRKKSYIPEDSDLLLYCDLVGAGKSYLGTSQVGENTNVSESSFLAILPWFLYAKNHSMLAEYPWGPVPSFKIWLRRMNGEKPVFTEDDVFYICLKLRV